MATKRVRQQLEDLLCEPLPEKGRDPEEVLGRVEQIVLRNMLHVDHPRFFGFIPSPSNFVSIMAETLSSGFNVFAGTWLEGSGAAQIELVTLNWLRQLCGLPETAGGLFVSGASAANLTAMALARDVHLRGRLDKGIVYCSDQTHSSVERGLRVVGIQPSQVHKLTSDEHFRISLKTLRRSIEEDRSLGKMPYCVVATAGTTNTGSVDPLPELAELCREEELWLHVDGAYGVSAVFSERGRELLTGLDQVDSLTLDPHKWMFQPYETGCLLVRDRSLLRERFHVLPEYLRDLDPLEEEVNFYDYGIQLTRSFRALKPWLSLQVFGFENFKKAVDRGFELAEMAERRVRASSRLALVTPAQMGILTFRFEPSGTSGGTADELHRRIVSEMIQDGFAFVSSTELRGRTVLHMCTINPRTTEDDIHRTIEKIEATGERLADKE